MIRPSLENGFAAISNNYWERNIDEALKQPDTCNAVADCAQLREHAQRRNSLVFILNNSIGYFVAPVFYVGVLHAAILSSLGYSDTLANLPESVYMWMTPLPVLIAWFWPSTRYLRRMLVITYVSQIQCQDTGFGNDADLPGGSRLGAGRAGQMVLVQLWSLGCRRIVLRLLSELHRCLLGPRTHPREHRVHERQRDRRQLHAADLRRDCGQLRLTSQFSLGPGNSDCGDFNCVDAASLAARAEHDGFDKVRNCPATEEFPRRK